MLIFGDKRINYQMRRSLRELSIDMVINQGIFKNTQITFFPSFTFIPKTDMGLPKTGISFYCESNAPGSLTLMSSVISELKDMFPQRYWSSRPLGCVPNTLVENLFADLISVSFVILSMRILYGPYEQTSPLVYKK